MTSVSLRFALGLDMLDLRNVVADCHVVDLSILVDLAKLLHEFLLCFGLVILKFLKLFMHNLFLKGELGLDISIQVVSDVPNLFNL